MTRVAVLLTFLVAACDVGSVTQGVGGGGPDAGSGSGSGDGGGSANGCDTVNATPQAGHHNAGQSCLQVGCHLEGQTGAGAPAYSFAGTLYRDAQQTQSMPGAKIIIVVNGTPHKLETDSLGNFSTSSVIVPSLTGGQQAESQASGCPTFIKGHGTGGQTGPLVQGNGSCNNCHTVGGTATPMHLP